VAENNIARQQLGVRLRAAREAAGLEARTVASKFDVSEKTVYAWETGGGLPDALRLRGLCRMYNASADDVLWGTTGSPLVKLPADLSASLALLDPAQQQHIERLVAMLVEAMRAAPPAAPPAPEPFPADVMMIAADVADTLDSYTRLSDRRVAARRIIRAIARAQHATPEPAAEPAAPPPASRSDADGRASQPTPAPARTRPR
jgi:transcriptional regulator with XRE-family HTH domain